MEVAGALPAWKWKAELAGALTRLRAPGLLGPTTTCAGKQVGVEDAPTVGVTVRVAVGGVPVTVGVAVPQAVVSRAISSTHQPPPVRATELSSAVRKRMSRFCPAKLARLTRLSTKLVRLGLPVQACRPAMGSHEGGGDGAVVAVEGDQRAGIHPGGPAVGRGFQHRAVEGALQVPAMPEGEAAPAGTLTALIVVRYWSVMSARSGAKAECVPEWKAVVTLDQPQPPGLQIVSVEVLVPSVPLSSLDRPAVQGVAWGSPCWSPCWYSWPSAGCPSPSASACPGQSARSGHSRGPRCHRPGVRPPGSACRCPTAR